MKVYITGIGCVTPIGLNKEENLHSLQNRVAGLRKAEFFHSKYASKLYFGEVNLSDKELISKLKVERLKGVTRTDLLAFKAFTEAVGDANLSETEISSRQTAFISASTVGGDVFDQSNL